VSDIPLVPGRVYGLRLWRVVAGEHGERLVSPDLAVEWPTGGLPRAARCERHGHTAPAPGCKCGVCAWHPRTSTARKVMQWRWYLPGIVEAWGAVEVHYAGFRAEWARPHTLISVPSRFPKQVERLAETYRAEIVELSRPAALVRHCERSGLGFDEPTVSALLGDEYEQARRATRRQRTAEAAWVAGAGLMIGAPVAAAALGLF
jgi:hypothetical protein